MAKPDLQAVYTKPDDGTPYRLKGKLGLAPVLLDLEAHNDDTAAGNAGIPIGGLYRTASVVKVRVA